MVPLRFPRDLEPRWQEIYLSLRFLDLTKEEIKYIFEENLQTYPLPPTPSSQAQGSSKEETIQWPRTQAPFRIDVFTKGYYPNRGINPHDRRSEFTVTSRILLREVFGSVDSWGKRVCQETFGERSIQLPSAQKLYPGKQTGH